VSTGGDACIVSHLSAGASEISVEAVDSLTIAVEERSERKRGMQQGSVRINSSI
jgi:hypothetical protein